MPSALDIAKTGWDVYSATKSAVSAVTKPVQWAKDQLVSLLVKGLLAGFTATVGPGLARRAVSKLDLVGKTLPFELTLDIPDVARALFERPDALSLVEAIANEALAAPLELLGYRLGTIQAAYDSGAHRLEVRLTAGLQTMALPINGPVGAVAAPSTT